jgi:hypothetical protein
MLTQNFMPHFQIDGCYLFTDLTFYTSNFLFSDKQKSKPISNADEN